MHQCATREELDEIRGPKVVFASTNTLDYGFAHDLFGEWAQDPKNLVVLTDRSTRGSLASLLAEGAERAGGDSPKKTTKKRGKKSKGPASTTSLPESISFIERRHEDLEGVQLERWAAAREAAREQRELERQQAAEKEEAANFRIDDGGKEQEKVREKVAGSAGGADEPLTESASSSTKPSSFSASSSSSESSTAVTTVGDADGAGEQGDLELKLIPLYAMFRFKEKSAYLDDYGVQGDLTAYMDQFALADATSAISLLVDGEGGDLTENTSKGSKKKRWKDRMAGGGKDDELDEDDEDDDYDDYDDYDDDDTVPQKLVETNVMLDIKCRYGHFCFDQCFHSNLYSSVF